METYNDLAELARICIKQSYLTSTKAVADALRQMAHDHQQRAAKLDGGKPPDIGGDGRG